MMVGRTKRIYWCIRCRWWERLMLHIHYIYWEVYCRQMFKTFYWLGGMIRCGFSCKWKISVNYIVYRAAEERVHLGGLSVLDLAGPWRLGGTRTDRPRGALLGNEVHPRRPHPSVSLRGALSPGSRSEDWNSSRRPVCPTLELQVEQCRLFSLDSGEGDWEFLTGE